MPTRCLKCGAQIEDGWPVCRKCFEPVKRPGFFSRLFSALRSRVNVNVSRSPTAPPGFTTQTISLRTNQLFKVRDAKTGEVREYHSLDEVPEEFRSMIRDNTLNAVSEELRALAETKQPGLTIKNTTNVTWTDPSGVVHHGKSLDELPPEMRAIFEKALKDTDAG